MFFTTTPMATEKQRCRRSRLGPLFFWIETFFFFLFLQFILFLAIFFFNIIPNFCFFNFCKIFILIFCFFWEFSHFISCRSMDVRRPSRAKLLNWNFTRIMEKLCWDMRVKASFLLPSQHPMKALCALFLMISLYRRMANNDNVEEGKLCRIYGN